MPELPDVQLYVEHLTRRLAGRVLERVRVASPFLLRTVTPPLAAAEGRTIRGIRRLGKRLVFELEEGPFLVVHLMVAGRFHWKDAGRAPVPGKVGLAAFDAAGATLLLTEASPKKRASLHVVAGEAELAALSRGGVEPLETDLAGFAAALGSESHTVKRALTDPRLVSGIGNAYSDEILHAARMSPFALTRTLRDEEVARLFGATRATLVSWIEKLRVETGERFPEKVTAFRPDFAVHGRYGRPCPACGDPVQRLVYADSESNYCATCQTGGRLLADRALSRLLRDDWPRTLAELEEGRVARRAG
ncbi:MAG: formamidopyrimidine-DNA glycosylase [Thermoanaerobaculia bacterium]|nr:formamidopyrimidine-DNA glycosylase [Thermoanaerobaculia bacterium]